jgi:drug/metabolite transporter (DMT)-like permease
MAELIGYILTLDALFTWAAASLVYKKNLGKTDPRANLFFRLCCVSVGTFFFSLIFGSFTFFFTIGLSNLIDYLIACFISGASVTAGDLLYFMSLKKIDVSRAYPLLQLSLIFVYPFAFFVFAEEIKISILVGGFLILCSVFILSSRDRMKKQTEQEDKEKVEAPKEDLLIGVLLAIIAAFLWALAIVSFNQARVISGDVFYTNFFRVVMATTMISIVGIFKREFLSGFKKENRKYLKNYIYIGIAGALSLGLADSLFYKAVEINTLVLTSTFTANTPMVQQILSIFILKEKFRKRFLIAVCLIIIGNYIMLFF